MTTSKTAPRRPTSSQMALYRAAVISGLYAKYGDAVMNAQAAEYTKAIRAIRRVANEQAAEMARASS